MGGKTPLILAPLIVGGAMLWFAFWMGKVFERASKRYIASYIDPKMHCELIDLLKKILVPSNVDQACYLPEPLKQQAEKLVARADEHHQRRRREELRRGL